MLGESRGGHSTVGLERKGKVSGENSLDDRPSVPSWSRRCKPSSQSRHRCCTPGLPLPADQGGQWGNTAFEAERSVLLAVCIYVPRPERERERESDGHRQSWWLPSFSDSKSTGPDSSSSRASSDVLRRERSVRPLNPPTRLWDRQSSDIDPPLYPPTRANIDQSAGGAWATSNKIALYHAASRFGSHPTREKI